MYFLYTWCTRELCNLFGRTPTCRDSRINHIFRNLKPSQDQAMADPTADLRQQLADHEADKDKQDTKCFSNLGDCRGLSKETRRWNQGSSQLTVWQWLTRAHTGKLTHGRFVVNKISTSKCNQQEALLGIPMSHVQNNKQLLNKQTNTQTNG